MNASIFQALIRHLLTALSGGFAVKYGVDGDTINVIVSGVSALAGLGWSIYDKKN